MAANQSSEEKKGSSGIDLNSNDDPQVVALQQRIAELERQNRRLHDTAYNQKVKVYASDSSQPAGTVPVGTLTCDGSQLKDLVAQAQQDDESKDEISCRLDAPMAVVVIVLRLLQLLQCDRTQVVSPVDHDGPLNDISAATSLAVQEYLMQQPLQTLKEALLFAKSVGSSLMVHLLESCVARHIEPGSVQAHLELTKENGFQRLTKKAASGSSWWYGTAFFHRIRADGQAAIEGTQQAGSSNGYVRLGLASGRVHQYAGHAGNKGLSAYMHDGQLYSKGTCVAMFRASEHGPVSTVGMYVDLRAKQVVFYMNGYQELHIINLTDHFTDDEMAAGLTPVVSLHDASTSVVVQPVCNPPVSVQRLLRDRVKTADEVIAEQNRQLSEARVLSDPSSTFLLRDGAAVRKVRLSRRTKDSLKAAVLPFLPAGTAASRVTLSYRDGPDGPVISIGQDQCVTEFLRNRRAILEVRIGRSGASA